MAEYERRNNSHSFDQVAPLIADDAIYFFNDGTFRGLPAIRQAIEKTWAYGVQDESYTIEDLSWLVQDEHIAVATYRYRWEGVTSDSRERQVLGVGRGTQVLRRSGDRWQTVHEHLSEEPG